MKPTFFHSLFQIIALALLSFALNAMPPFKGKDPTRPPVEQDYVSGANGNTGKGYVLNTIIISQSRRLALINNKLVRPGEIIDKAQVKSIHSNYVILLIDRHRVKINLIDKTNWDSWR